MQITYHSIIESEVFIKYYYYGYMPNFMDTTHYEIRRIHLIQRINEIINNCSPSLNHFCSVGHILHEQYELPIDSLLLIIGTRDVYGCMDGHIVLGYNRLTHSYDL